MINRLKEITPHNVRFFTLEGKTYNTVSANKDLCSYGETGEFTCAFMDKPSCAEIGAYDICQHGFAFEEVLTSE